MHLYLQHGKSSEPTEVVATTYQAISGAGKTFKDWPEMVGNIIPFIGGEGKSQNRNHLDFGVKLKTVKSLRLHHLLLQHSVSEYLF